MSQLEPKEALPSDDGTPDKGALVHRLLAMWGEIQPYVDESMGSHLAGAQRLVVERWLSLFEPEILYVRAARNSVVHSPDAIPQSELRGAAEAASKLREFLFTGLDNPAAVLGKAAPPAS